MGTTGVIHIVDGASYFSDLLSAYRKSTTCAQYEATVSAAEMYETVG